MGKTTCDALLRTACSQAAASSIGWGKALPGNVDMAPFLEQAWQKRFPQCSSQFRGLRRVDELNLPGCDPAQPCHFVERRQES